MESQLTLPAPATRVPPFRHGGKVYDLSHLDPRVVEFIQPGAGERPAIVYKVNLMFTQHPFTSAIPAAGCDPSLVHLDGKERRMFDVDRWELSKRLPEIVAGLAGRQCRHASEGNFVTVELVDAAGDAAGYDVFFVASKAKRPGYINLLIQSAYASNRRHSGKPVAFFVVLNHALRGKAIRP